MKQAQFGTVGLLGMLATIAVSCDGNETTTSDAGMDAGVAVNVDAGADASVGPGADAGIDSGGDAGPPCTCNTPPPNECVSGDSVFRTYASTGACNEAGNCEYDAIDVPCASCLENCMMVCEGVVCDQTNGGCLSNGRCVPGTPATCAYDLATDRTSCDTGLCLDGECVECLDDADCNSDTTVCTPAETCDSVTHTCSATPPLASGAPCEDDGNVCTNDVCDGSGACVHVPVSFGTPCANDGNVCTLDICDSGACTHPPVENGTPCVNDGLYCTGVEQCISGECRSTGNPCPGHDGDNNCSESCNETADSCTASDNCPLGWCTPKGCLKYTSPYANWLILTQCDYGGYTIFGSAAYHNPTPNAVTASAQIWNDSEQLAAGSNSITTGTSVSAQATYSNIRAVTTVTASGLVQDVFIFVGTAGWVFAQQCTSAWGE